MLNVSFNLDALLTGAQQAYSADDMVQARALATQVLQQQEEHPKALHLLGAIALHEGQPDVAVGFLERAQTRQPERAAIHCDLATSLEGVGRAEDAIRHYRLALALEPELALARENLQTILAVRGQTDVVPPADAAYVAALNQLAARISSANLQLAIRLYDRSLDADAAQPEILARLGSLYLQTGQARSAIDVLRRAVGLGHRDVESFHSLAKALRKRTIFEEALEAARAAAALEPGNLDIQWTITQILSDIHTRNDAIAKLRAALAANPDSEDLKFELAGLTEDVDLSTFPLSRVTTLFEYYAKTFESHLVERLNYRGHEQIYHAVTSVGPGRVFDILDLGCGTGLCGVQFKPIARYLKGVDVAPSMIDKARTRGIYDALEVQELVAALSGAPGEYDLILAADVLEYLGKLEPTFAAAAQALRPQGLFAFSVERTDKPGFIFNRHTSSFAHSLEYVHDLARQNGLTRVYTKEYPLRVEGRTPLMAWIVVLQK